MVQPFSKLVAPGMLFGPSLSSLLALQMSQDALVLLRSRFGAGSLIQYCNRVDFVIGKRRER